MSDEKTEIDANYAAALVLAWFIFPEEPREVIEERARNFVANMERVNATRTDKRAHSQRVA